MLPDIVTLIVAAAGVLVSLLPATVGALYQGHRNSLAAGASVVMGFAAFVCATVISPTKKTAFVPAVLTSVFVYYTARRISRGRESRETQ